MESLNYVKPKSLQEACAILKEKGAAAAVLAGGTDLFVKLRQGKIRPEWLIDLKGLGLDNIVPLQDGGVSIGALATLNSILDNILIHERFPVLRETAEMMASVQIRNRATIGGNLCNASPSSDMAAPLLVLGAKVIIAGSNGERQIDLGEFFQGPGKADLCSGEILKEILIPPTPAHSGAVYLKQTRNAMDLALAGVAVLLTLNSDGSCENGCIALSAVSATPFIAKNASAALHNTKNSSAIVKNIAELAALEAKPINDIRASSWYRMALLKTLTADAIQEALKRADQTIGETGGER